MPANIAFRANITVEDETSRQAANEHLPERMAFRLFTAAEDRS